MLGQMNMKIPVERNRFCQYETQDIDTWFGSRSFVGSKSKRLLSNRFQ